MSISSVSSATTYATTSASSSSSTSSFSADDFLSLLVEQLQNQDPLNPTDTSEIMSQMVSFASYQQQAESNTALSEISSTLNSIASALDISV
ncbi:flagellar hook capping FlgD N-terminal domain-containing protein [Devosia sp. CN2-171]|uniref:flagellar hook capping FlgD N-terminal domain-containing protein n=1 Tax=Devosia sp. CN2-171 TaxID=3400909 RepID=UPI003BF87D02